MKLFRTLRIDFLSILFTIVLVNDIKAQEKSLELSNEELVWIEEHRTVYVANEMDWPPFDFVDGDLPSGYSIDLISMISEKAGMNIEFVNGYTWNELLELFKRDEIQILPAVFKDDERSEYMAFTSSYYLQPSILVTNINDSINSIHDLTDKNIAVIKGFSITAELESKYPEINAVEVKSIKDGLLKVSTGELDGFVESIGVVSYYLEENYIPNLKISSDVQLEKMNSPPLYIAVHKRNPVLHGILQKGLESISQDEMKTLREKWVASESLDEDDSFNFSYLIFKSIAVIALLFIIGHYSIKYFFKKVVKEEIVLEIGSRRFRIITMIGTLIILLVISFFGYMAMEHNKNKILNDLEVNLETTLENTHERLKLWIDHHKLIVQEFGRDPILVKSANEILSIPIERDSLITSQALINLREFYRRHQDELQSVGFFIIDTNAVNLASSRDENIGLKNLIYKQRPELLEMVFEGNSVFVPPIESDVFLNGNLRKEIKPASIFFVSPVQNAEGKILAALAIRLDPSKGFSKVMQLTRIGRTGECYVFGEKGRLLSESRFKTDLRNLGLISYDYGDILQLEIRNPGGDMTTGFIPKVSRNDQPLTLMAADAIKGKSGTNMTGYRDYRGVMVYGSWLWDKNLRMGMASEIDITEGNSTYTTMRLTVLGVFGGVIILTILAILFSLELGEKANLALINAKGELENRVILRTKQLNKEKAFLKTLINAIPDIIFYKDTRKRYLGANLAFEKHMGLNINDLAGKTDLHILDKERAEKHLNSDDFVLKKGTSELFESVTILPNGKRIVVETLKTPYFSEDGKLAGLIGIGRDITDRKETEEKIRASENRFRSITSTAIDAIVSANKHGIIESWNPAATRIFGYTEEEALGQNLEIIIPEKYHKGHQEGMKRVLSGGEKRAIGHIVEMEGKKKDNTIFPVTLALSMWEGIDQMNFSGIIRDITKRKKNEALMMQANKRMEGELNVGKDIQMSMLPLTFPAFPNRKEIDIYADLIPAREVGGDFYDFNFLDENHICLAVGDVSGKGVPAALEMAVAKTLLKSNAANDRSTASILTQVNNEIAKDNDTYMFITVFIAILNTDNGKFVYSNAGHNPSYIIGKNRDITILDELHGPVIGAMEGMTYNESTLYLEKDDMVLAYTDGVSEAQNIHEEFYGVSRLTKLIKTGEYDSTRSLTDLIVKNVKHFEDGTEQFDDITVLAIQYLQDKERDSSEQTAIKIFNKISEMPKVIAHFEAFASQNDLTPKAIQKFNIVLDELLNNIISYAYNDYDDHIINIKFQLKYLRLIITIEDDGIPFNPFRNEAPDIKLSISERNLGGLGVHIVKNLVDEYHYIRQSNKNIINLIKYNVNTNSI
ncbi:SpoIIE family protein phosphatase [Lutimonas zeaxanthinifaciens]|uniref:SpoIIE family protein phosphatase n=1 Tax=Lutimonas zeaxanthinifaciens TaxID=3060215 RepID=UPI00265D28C5|nr:SpoIIE family protein phosphatase [Lutimonas sp. YSD2104]WKK66639.1 SpoIIE family protein phosphatase [Lutimonas sp. YSD2104]